MLIPRITRVELKKIAESSDNSESAEIKEFISSLESRGLYTEATEDEMEELDEII